MQAINIWLVCLGVTMALALVGFWVVTWATRQPPKRSPLYDANPPCGMPEEHHEWTREQGWRCPLCASKAAHKRKDEDRKILAALIASELHRLQKEDSQNDLPLP